MFAIARKYAQLFFSQVKLQYQHTYIMSGLLAVFHAKTELRTTLVETKALDSNQSVKDF